jgi:hypothetical protein
MNSSVPTALNSVSFLFEMTISSTSAPLIGLGNRLLFNTKLSLEIALNQQLGSFLAVLFLDLYRFKLTSCTILKNRQDACSTKSKFSCGTGKMPVLKKLIENGATSQFKTINDTLGILWEMTCSKQLLKGLLKSFARWGGDEFTILFTKLSGRDVLLDAPLSKKPSNPLLFSKTIIYTSPSVLASPYIHKLE